MEIEKEKVIERIKDKPVPVLHGFAAADYARREMGIDDSETLMAIKSHTCGRAGMSDMEKVIYLADYIEPSRDFPGVEELRSLAFTNIDKALKLGLEMTLEHLKNLGDEVSPASREALEFLNNCS